MMCGIGQPLTRLMIVVEVRSHAETALPTRCKTNTLLSLFFVCVHLVLFFSKTPNEAGLLYLLQRYYCL